MDPEILHTVLDEVEVEPTLPEGFKRGFRSLTLSAVPVNPLPIVILMKTVTETEVLKSVIREISIRYGLRVSVTAFTSAYDALFYMELPCTRATTVYTYDTLDRVHTETSISQRAEMVPVSPARARAIIMDKQFSQDPDMQRVMDAGGLLEQMIILLPSDESLALQMAAIPTKLNEDLPQRSLSLSRFGFQKPGQLLGMWCR